MHKDEYYEVGRFANDIGGPGIEYDIPINGLFQIYWSNGNLRYEWYYKDGERADGISKSWFSNGQLKQEFNWKDGRRNGLFTEWYETGEKLSEGTWKGTIRDGVWTYWYENGQKKRERTYKDGEIISKKCWDNDGIEKECE